MGDFTKRGRPAPAARGLTLGVSRAAVPTRRRGTRRPASSTRRTTGPSGGSLAGFPRLGRGAASLANRKPAIDRWGELGGRRSEVPPDTSDARRVPKRTKPPVHDRRLSLGLDRRERVEIRGPGLRSGVCVPRRAIRLPYQALGAAAARGGHMAAPVAPVTAAAILAAAVTMAAVAMAPLLAAPLAAALGRAAALFHPAARGGRAARLGSGAGRGRTGRSGAGRSSATAAHLAAAVTMAAVAMAPLTAAALAAALGRAAARLTPAAAAHHGK
jgi:hypothetical protein